MSRFRAVLRFARRRGIPMVSWEQVRASRLGLRLEVLGVFGLLKDYLSVAKAVSLVVGVVIGFIFCLIAVGMAYSRYSDWRVFRAPSEGLTYVTDTDAPERNDFRKGTVSVICDPVLRQIERIEDIREQTKGGTVEPVTLEEDLDEVRNRLKDIMTEARRRRIPWQFRDTYERSIYAIQDAYRSANELEDSFEQETDAAGSKLYHESIKNGKLAKHRCNQTRDFFTSDDWREQ